MTGGFGDGRLPMSRASLRRALIVAAIVGPVLALINHGDAILSGALDVTAALKIIVTFFVPFCVSCVSSALAAADSAADVKPGKRELLSPVQIPHTSSPKE